MTNNLYTIYDPVPSLTSLIYGQFHNHADKSLRHMLDNSELRAARLRTERVFGTTINMIKSGIFVIDAYSV